MIADVLTAAVAEAMRAIGVDIDRPVAIEQPSIREHGDWSTNVALAYSKSAGMPPRALAERLVTELQSAALAHVDQITIAGPGFVNFHLRPSWLHEALVEVLRAGSEFGRGASGSLGHAMVEFISANPTGPLHAGHARGACYGDAVANLLEAIGWSVTREFYVNDLGVQMDRLGESILARSRGEEPPADGYLGEYISEWSADFHAPEGDRDQQVAAATAHGYARALDDQREVLQQLGVQFDQWTSERSIVESGAVESALARLEERGLLERSEGALWLRTTTFGDDKDRVLIKSDGEYTYFLPDIAYHLDKFARGVDLAINVWGADHHGYVPRMMAAIEALGYRRDQLDVRVTQLVRLVRNGEEVKISKRAGNLIELRDIIEEVGADATRMTYLSQSVDAPQTADLAEIAAQSMDNPVFYVQMAHARIRSVQRNAGERVPAATLDELAALTADRELDLIRCLRDWPRLCDVAARERAPHKVANWLRELAAAVHGFYHDCPILRSDVPAELASARLALIEGARIGLVQGLSVLGVGAPEEM